MECTIKTKITFQNAEVSLVFKWIIRNKKYVLETTLKPKQNKQIHKSLFLSNKKQAKV